VEDLLNHLRGFDNGEIIAWRSASALAGLLDQLNTAYPGKVYLMAHSHGNVVAGEALRLLGRQKKKINTYVACEAAVSAGAYDVTMAAVSPLHFPPTTGPTTPDIYPTWLRPNSAGVTSEVNFFNRNDLILTLWELDQEFKPDNAIIGSDFGYGYGDPVQSTNPLERFWKVRALSGTIQLHIGNAANLRDRYEIMSFAAEAESRALGRVFVSVAGFEVHDMPGEQMWGTDPLAPHDFSDRKWHSGQFNFTNMQVRKYWAALLYAFGLSRP
jgi:hypothetical protein